MSEAPLNEGAANEPPIDMEAYRWEMRNQGLEELIEELIATFVGDASIRFEALRAAVEAAEPEEIRAAAHAYKSPAATMRASRLAGVLEQMEAAARAGEVTKAVALMPVVRLEHEAVVAQLRQN